jgi:hypothetical protein
MSVANIGRPAQASERVAIAEALRGQIDRGHGGDRRSDQVQNFALETQGRKTRDIVAEKAGSGVDGAARA